ncbi:MAG TPA: ABC transporter substrate-binding protein, partial [Candidatus Dojkabacteria bacterium]|nr:ABC transporter substrate-binding protein [Candidatus Dojkabacteria bacterium]
MKKAKKVKDSPKEGSIMKSVLEELNVKASPIQEKKKFDLRDIFWNYPEFLISTYRKFIPLSYILLFGLLVFLFTLILNSNNFANSLRRSNSDDTFVEGVVGGVNTLNPLFVTNNYIERSLESLIFEKFVNIDSNGQPYSGIAKNWEVKENGLVYIFTIDKGHFWHDGTKVTIDDVIFTFNSAIELSKEAGFDSVGLAFAEMEVNKIDENTLQLKINEANPVFFRAISIYILPQKHLKDVEINKIAFAPFSKAPIGSGKYSFVKMDSSSVSLVDNVYDRYNPKIKNFVFKLYPDDKSLEMAFRVGRLDSIGSWDRTLSNYV